MARLESPELRFRAFLVRETRPVPCTFAEACAGLPRGHAALGEFTWLRRRDPAAALFFGPEALFPFQSGRPPDSEASALFAQGLDWDELEPRWLPYEELLVDSWDEPSLLLTARVPATLARSFAGGDEAFPEAALVASGCAMDSIAELRRGSLAAERVDRTHGKARYELETAEVAALLPVTWQDSVATLLGAKRVEAFRSLRSYGPDSELRVIALLG